MAVIDIVMPRLGWTMETGKVVEWLKQEGDPIEPGDLLFSVENDKAITEVEAIDSGVLHFDPSGPQLGEDVPVGGRLAILVPPGEAVPDLGGALSAGAVPTARVETSQVQAAPVAAVAARQDGETPAISPRARRIAAELGVDWTGLSGSGSSGRIVERDVRAAASAAPAGGQRLRATPSVRRLAEDLGVDLGVDLGATLPGRATRADVLAASRGGASPASIPGIDPALRAEAEVVPFTAIRRITAERMSAAARTAAPVTLTTEADVTELHALRNRMKADGQAADSGRTIPTYTDLIARLTALALLDHPDLNASLDGEQILRHRSVHMGIAVDTERGLLVPVIRDAQLKSAGAIAAESADLIGKARSGRAPIEALQGSTFTISNLGMFDIDAFTPIINLPECAVLGLGRIVARPVVVNDETDEVAVRRMMALSLTFDHRIVDGAPAARFLKQLKTMLEHPTLWLV